uniref:Uncharacterized protein n=1 Tax=Caenorhabditis japonica TaxID=281687 RepID=A0A8R1HZI6_CAEJA
MKRELNHDAFNQSIWRANDMDPNPVQSVILSSRVKVNKIIQYIPKPINCMPNRVYDLVTSNEGATKD